MNRRLIIISNDGGKEDYLAGVKIDVESYLNFFTSPEGGAWDECEYKVCEIGLFTPAMLHLFMSHTEKEAHVDYWLIVFVGHGGSEIDGSTYFWFTNHYKCPENQIIYDTSNSRCLLIADSCSVVEGLNEEDNPERLLYFSESLNTDHKYRAICRNDYNKRIMRVPIGCIQKGYAAKFKQCAYENPDGTGGYYTQSLLKVANKEIKNAITDRMNNPQSFSGEAASFSWIHSQAKPIVEELSEGRQSPILYNVRTAQFPFYVVPPYILD